jgi:hypothetical protein
VPRPSLRQDFPVSLTRDQIVTALERLDAHLGAVGAQVELYIVGGAVMCVGRNARASTKDVDGWFTEPQIVRGAAARVAEELSLPSDWLNDAAKGFIPEGARFETWRKLPNLEIPLADDETLFAMKCAAARTDLDRADIEILAGRLQITSFEQALTVVLRYFPEDRLPVRTRLLLEELLDDRP